jgi:DnaJ-domain-containing protein 1
MALSRFQLDWDQFLQLTPLEFFLALEDNEQTETQKIQIIAEGIRLSTWWLVNLQVKKKIRRPEKLWGLPTDGMARKEPQTRDQMKNVMKAIAADTKNKKKRPVTVIPKNRRK